MDSKKFFIPGWLLSDAERTNSEKLVLSVLSTLSSDVQGGRISKGLSAAKLAAITAQHERSVLRSIKALERAGLLRRVPGGFMLMNPREGQQGEQEQAQQGLGYPPGHFAAELEKKREWHTLINTREKLLNALKERYPGGLTLYNVREVQQELSDAGHELVHFPITWETAYQKAIDSGKMKATSALKIWEQYGGGADAAAIS